MADTYVLRRFLKKKFNVFPYVLQIFFKIKSYQYTPMSPSSHLLLLPLFLELGFATQLAPLTFGARYFFLIEKVCAL